MGTTTYPAMGRGERTDVTWRLVKGDGTPFWCRMIGRPLDPADPNEGSVWMMEDITDQMDAEQERLSLEVQLRQAQKLEAIGQLAAGIAHEINTPIQYIGDNTKFLAGAFTDVFKVMDAQDAAGGPRRRAAPPQGGGGPPLPARGDPQGRPTSPWRPRPRHEDRAGHEGLLPPRLRENPVAVDLNQAIESTVTVRRNEWKDVADLNLDLDPGLGKVPCLPTR